jgi:hypothetical protein
MSRVILPLDDETAQLLKRLQRSIQLDLLHAEGVNFTEKRVDLAATLGHNVKPETIDAALNLLASFVSEDPERIIFPDGFRSKPMAQAEIFTTLASLLDPEYTGGNRLFSNHVLYIAARKNATHEELDHATTAIRAAARAAGLDVTPPNGRERG